MHVRLGPSWHLDGDSAPIAEARAKNLGALAGRAHGMIKISPSVCQSYKALASICYTLSVNTLLASKFNIPYPEQNSEAIAALALQSVTERDMQLQWAKASEPLEHYKGG